MKKISKTLWGLVLIALGVLLALRAFHLLDFSLFFDGWWTLFIIIPCGIGLLTDRDKTSDLIGLLVGVLLLLWRQDLLEGISVWQLILAGIVLVVGVGVLIKVVGGKTDDEKIKRAEESQPKGEGGYAAFSGTNVNYDNQVFEGTELTALFGSVRCDLTRATVEKDCVIQVSAVFGGVVILLPDNVNVKVNVGAIFGGVSSSQREKQVQEGLPTVYLKGSAMFGGVKVQ